MENYPLLTPPLRYGIFHMFHHFFFESFPYAIMDFGSSQTIREAFKKKKIGVDPPPVWKKSTLFIFLFLKASLRVCHIFRFSKNLEILENIDFLG